MPLSESQRAKLTAEAARRGVDPDKLIAAAERAVDGAPPTSDKAPSGKPAKTDRPLYMYHLPFVTVNEVRTTWLGLEPIAGGEANAAKYAAEQAGPSASAKPEPPPE